MKVLLVLFALSAPAAAAAQTPPTTTPPPPVSRFSVGINGGVFLRPTDGLLDIGGDGLLVFGPNLTINTSRRSAVQFTSSIVGEHSQYSSGTVVFYAIQYRRTFRDGGRARTYWTIGGAGTVTHRNNRERTLTGPNFYGVIRADDVTYHVDAYTSTTLRPPVFPVFSVGTERFIRRRLAIRADVLISFLAVRAAAGFSVPLGRLK